jgi:hypothetical protein
MSMDAQQKAVDEMKYTYFERRNANRNGVDGETELSTIGSKWNILIVES